jgi:hypothetical protein
MSSIMSTSVVVSVSPSRVGSASRRRWRRLRVSRGVPLAPRASAKDTPEDKDSAPAKFTNADAFKALDAIGGKASSGPFGGAGGLGAATASNPFASAAAPAAASVAGFRAPSTDAASLPTKADADRLLTRFDRDQRRGELPDASSPEGSPQCTHPPMRQSVRALAASSSRVMLGICAPDAAGGLAALKAWVTDLGLPRGKLHGMDIDGVEQPPPEGPVFLKYNSDSGDAFLSGYGGEFRGVLFTPELGDGSFRQYGYLPLDLPAGGEKC